MGETVKVSKDEVDTAKRGIMMHFEAMFTPEQRAIMTDFGIDGFISHMASVSAADKAFIRFYSSIIHADLTESK